MDRGYSHEDKIKILYEESLTDIREITARLEKLTSLIIDANSVRATRSEERDAVVVNPWAAAFGMLCALTVGLGINVSNSQNLGVGLGGILAGGIACFFYFRRNENKLR